MGKLFWIVAVAVSTISFSNIPHHANASESPAKSTRIIHSASELDYPPFSIIRDDGSADGFSVALLTAVAKAIRLNVDFEVGPWGEIKEDLISGQLDVLPLVSYSEERDEQMDFTAPYLRMHGTIFVRKGEVSIKNEADLKDKEVIVMRGDTAHEYVTRKKLTDHIFLTDNYEDAMEMLSAGKHDAVVVQYLVGLQLLKNMGISNVAAVQSVQEISLKPTAKPLSGFEQKFCIAVREGDDELQTLLNEGLALVIASGQYDELYHKWFGPILPDKPVSLMQIAKYLLYIILPLMGLTLIIGVWWLRKEVARKTEKLNKQIAISEEKGLAYLNSEKHLRTLINTLPDMVWLKDSAGNYLSCNERFGNCFGATEKEIIGKTDYDFVDKELADCFRKNDQLAVDRGTAVKNEEEVVFADDGHHEILETIKTPMYDSEGELVGVLGIGRDISLRKQTEEKLRATTARLRAVLNNSPLLISEVDLNGRYLLINKAIAEVYQLPQSDVIGKTFKQLLPLEIAKIFMESLNRVKEVRRPIYVEDSISVGGTEKIYTTTLFPLLDNSGNIQSVGTIAQDVTDRVQAERKLEESHDLLENLASLVPGVIYQYRLFPDGSSAFPYSSPGINDIYEVTPEDVRENATAVFGRLHPDDYDRVAESIFESARTLEMIYCEFRVNLPRQGLRWRWSQAMPQRMEDGGTLWHGIIIDITDRKQAEKEQAKLKDQLQQAQKMESVGRLAGGVAHDYNNMLSVITGYTELALEKIHASDPLHSDLEEVQKAAHRSVDITRQLLAFARKQTIAPQVVDLNAIVESMLKMLKRLIGEDIEMNWFPDGRAWPVYMDPAQIDQILANLCVNARDAISGVGNLTIETHNIMFDEAYCENHPGSVPGEYALLAVSDDGSGMDKETVDNIFEPFFTTKDRDEGTGLGLATVFGIVKQNKGFINVYSEPGKGTTFKIYLPRHIGDVKQDKFFRTSKAPDGHGETVLLVEDEPAIMKMAQQMLSRLQYNVLPAGTPTQALALAKEHPGDIDLLISDVIMPEMNGRDLSNQIQTICPGLKIIFMSGYTANVIAHHGVLEKGTNFIQKPFSLKDLGVKIRDVLDNANGET